MRILNRLWQLSIFKQLFADPKAVRELMVYSKSENSVFLRWLPPHPPYGVLRGYFVTYSYKSYFTTYSSEKKVPIRQCGLWYGYHCVELQNLLEGYEYTITVRCNFILIVY